MAAVDLIQNSVEWKNFRRGKIGSSSAPIVMGASPYMTPYELWSVMTGKISEPDFSNFATQRGHDVEPIARATYSLDKNREVMKDVVLVHDEVPWMIASLDGYMMIEDTEGHIKYVVLEIKCARDEIFQMCKRGQVHEQYVWQLEHQLLVSGADHVDFMCVKTEQDSAGKYRITEWHVVHYHSDTDRRALLLEKETEFMEMVKTNTPPPLTHNDVLERTEDDVVARYAKMADIKDQIDLREKEVAELKEELEPLKLQAIAAMKHTREAAAGLVLTKQVSTTVDNASIVKSMGDMIDTAAFTKTKETYVLRRTKS